MDLTQIGSNIGNLFNQANQLVNNYNSSQLNPATTVPQLSNIGGKFINQMQQSPIDWGNYWNQVHANQQQPFFNNTGNNPLQWMGKVVQDIQQRGPFEGLQDLSYPILMNPYIEPVEEPIVGNIRVANYHAGRPNWLVNNLLGQTDKQMAK